MLPVGFIESHGTGALIHGERLRLICVSGTSLGDLIEIQGINEVHSIYLSYYYACIPFPHNVQVGQLPLFRNPFI